MKKTVRTWLALVLGAVGLFGFAGCSGDDDDSGGGSGGGVNYGAAGTASISEYASGKVIRNKVVNLEGSSSPVYYEYLTFTSAEGGTYSVYADTNGTKEPVTSITLGGEAIDVPETFKYDKSMGKFTVTINGEPKSTYMLETTKDGAAVPVVAGEILAPASGTASESLFTTWRSAVGDTYAFNSDGTAVCTPASGTAVSCDFANAGGWITLSGLSLLWAKGADGTALYCPVCTTERDEVSAAGRSLSESGGLTAFVSHSFLLLK